MHLHNRDIEDIKMFTGIKGLHRLFTETLKEHCLTFQGTSSLIKSCNECSQKYFCLLTLIAATGQSWLLCDRTVLPFTFKYNNDCYEVDNKSNLDNRYYSYIKDAPTCFSILSLYY